MHWSCKTIGNETWIWMAYWKLRGSGDTIHIYASCKLELGDEGKNLSKCDILDILSFMEIFLQTIGVPNDKSRLKPLCFMQIKRAGYAKTALPSFKSKCSA